MVWSSIIKLNCLSHEICLLSSSAITVVVVCTILMRTWVVDDFGATKLVGVYNLENCRFDELVDHHFFDQFRN